MGVWKAMDTLQMSALRRCAESQSQDHQDGDYFLPRLPSLILLNSSRCRRSPTRSTHPNVIGSWNHSSIAFPWRLLGLEDRVVRTAKPAARKQTRRRPGLSALRPFAFFRRFILSLCVSARLCGFPFCALCVLSRLIFPLPFPSV